jgi:hypothetical protein
MGVDSNTYNGGLFCPSLKTLCVGLKERSSMSLS